MFVGLGLLAWAGGMTIWAYYLFFSNVEVPYPSLADAIFVFSMLFWMLGILQMAKVVGVRFTLRNKGERTKLLIISCLFALFSIYLTGSVRGWDFTQAGGLELFFNLFYAIGGVVVCTLAIFTYQGSRKLLGGAFEVPILLLLFGFVLNYAGDSTFFYVTVNETYFNGHFADFLYATAMFTLSLSLALMAPHADAVPQAEDVQT